MTVIQVGRLGPSLYVDRPPCEGSDEPKEHPNLPKQSGLYPPKLAAEAVAEKDRRVFTSTFAVKRNKPSTYHPQSYLIS